MAEVESMNPSYEAASTAGSADLYGAGRTGWKEKFSRFKDKFSPKGRPPAEEAEEKSLDEKKWAQVNEVELDFNNHYMRDESDSLLYDEGNEPITAVQYLTEARNNYVKAYAEAKANKQIKKRSALPEAVKEVKADYAKAKLLYGRQLKEKLEEELGTDLSPDHLKAILYETLVVSERQKYEEAKGAFESTKISGIKKALMWWRSRTLLQRGIISSTAGVVGGVVVVLGTPIWTGAAAGAGVSTFAFIGARRFLSTVGMGKLTPEIYKKISQFVEKKSGGKESEFISSFDLDRMEQSEQAYDKFIKGKALKKTVAGLGASFAVSIILGGATSALAHEFVPSTGGGGSGSGGRTAIESLAKTKEIKGLLRMASQVAQIEGEYKWGMYELKLHFGIQSEDIQKLFEYQKKGYIDQNELRAIFAKFSRTNEFLTSDELDKIILTPNSKQEWLHYLEKEYGKNSNEFKKWENKELRFLPDGTIEEIPPVKGMNFSLLSSSYGEEEISGGKKFISKLVNGKMKLVPIEGEASVTSSSGGSIDHPASADSSPHTASVASFLKYTNDRFSALRDQLEGDTLTPQADGSIVWSDVEGNGSGVYRVDSNGDLLFHSDGTNKWYRMKVGQDKFMEESSMPSSSKSSVPPEKIEPTKEVTPNTQPSGGADDKQIDKTDAEVLLQNKKELADNILELSKTVFQDRQLSVVVKSQKIFASLKDILSIQDADNPNFKHILFHLNNNNFSQNEFRDLLTKEWTDTQPLTIDAIEKLAFSGIGSQAELLSFLKYKFLALYNESQEKYHFNLTNGKILRDGYEGEYSIDPETQDLLWSGGKSADGQTFGQMRLRVGQTEWGKGGGTEVSVANGEPTKETPAIPVELAPEAVPGVGASTKIELPIGPRGPEGAIIDYFRGQPDEAKKFGWNGTDDLNKWAGRKAHRLWLAQAEEARKPDGVPDNFGDEASMRRIASGKVIIEADSSNSEGGKISLSHDTKILPPRPTVNHTSISVVPRPVAPSAPVVEPPPSGAPLSPAAPASGAVGSPTQEVLNLATINLSPEQYNSVKDGLILDIVRKGSAKPDSIYGYTRTYLNKYLPDSNLIDHHGSKKLKELLKDLTGVEQNPFI